MQIIKQRSNIATIAILAISASLLFASTAQARQDCTASFHAKAKSVVESFFNSNRLSRYSGARMGMTVSPALWASLDGASKLNLVKAISCAIGGVGNITLITLHNRSTGKKIAEMTTGGAHLF